MACSVPLFHFQAALSRLLKCVVAITTHTAGVLIPQAPKKIFSLKGMKFPCSDVVHVEAGIMSCVLETFSLHTVLIGWDRIVDERTQNELLRLLPRLKRFAISLTRNQSEADDLVQTACEKAISRIDQWDSQTRLDSWMFRIVQNTHLDALRQNKRHASKLNVIRHHHETTIDGRQTTEVTMTLENVRRAILELPSEQRAVIMMVCVEGYSYREASEILDIPTGTLTSRLVRARTALAQTLDSSAPVKQDNGMSSSAGKLS